MFFTLLLTASTIFTINVVSIVAYHDQDNNKYYGLEPINENLKGITVKKSERKEEKYEPLEIITTLSEIYKPKKVISTSSITSIYTPTKKRTPIKVIHDDWFMKHYDRICELEAISHRSVLDMYDHEDIFKRFSDLKMLARNLAWEQKQNVK